MEFLPLFVKLTQLEALVVGGGLVAARKTQLLRAAGANVTLVAPNLCPELVALVAAKALTYISAAFVPTLISDQRLVIAATDDAATNEAVARAAREAGVLVNVVDDLALSTCIVPAIIDRDPVLVAVSTGGSSPVLATQLRAQIETLLPTRLGELAHFARRHRAAVKARLPELAARRRFWTSILQADTARLILAGKIDDADFALTQALTNAEDAHLPPHCQLAALTSMDPEKLTLGTLRGLYTAEALLYDESIAPEILAYARRDAERRALRPATSVSKFLQVRTAAIREAAEFGPVFYLCLHSGTWLDLLARELRSLGFLTNVG